MMLLEKSKETGGSDEDKDDTAGETKLMKIQ